MTETNARKVADVILAVAAVGIVYYVVKTPPLRRMAWSLAATALTGTLPAWLSREMGTAWTESAGREI